MVAPAGRQLRLLLWKDYLIRKRNFVTLGGVVWATTIMLALYVVRVNIDNQNFPDCQYAARALPSAGMLRFVQSFICSVDNQCSPMDQFQEMPAYEDSKLSIVQSKLSPLLYNETVLEVAGSVPGALKLLATIARVLDEPTLLHITKNGLKVEDLFQNPDRVRRYIASEMNMSHPIAEAIMKAELSIQGIMKYNVDRCDVKSVSSLIKVENTKYMESFVSQLCRLNDKELQRLASELLLEINFSKYITMMGNMYYKLSGDKRVLSLAEFVRAATHFTRLDSYLPRVFTALFEQRTVDFSYFNVTILTNLMDQFEPTFGKTQAYKILRDITDTVAMALEYLDKIFNSNNAVEKAGSLLLSGVGDNIDADMKSRDISAIFTNAINIFEKATAEEPFDVFKILSQLANFISKILPDKTRHDVQFYSTLLAKLIEGANKVVTINWDIQKMAYDISLRNPDGVKILINLPLHVVTKGLEALADAERTQILTSKLNVRGQIFCDGIKMSNFFKISKKEADSLKSQLCTDAWKNYIGDLIKSFGIYEVRDLINNMASLMIQETFGKDTSDQLYSIEKDFQILKNFTNSLVRAKSKGETVIDWNKLFNVTDDSEFMKIFNERAHLGKQILITAHGALAKEVVKQNTILEYKISPFLLDLTTVVEAINAQLRLTPEEISENMKKLYPDIVKVMLDTVMDENKTYRALSTPSSDIVCNGSDVADTYLDISSVDNKETLISILCDASKAIDRGLKNDSIIAEAIATIRISHHGTLEEVNWTKLINAFKELYVKLDRDYPYLFEYTSYRMDGDMRAGVDRQLSEAKQFWFSANRIDRVLRLSIKLVFRLLELVDSGAFNVTSSSWLQGKFYLTAARGPLNAAHVFVSLLSAGSPARPAPPGRSGAPPALARALVALSHHAPRLLADAANIILSNHSYVEPMLSLLNSDPPWPCSGSMSDVLQLSPQSKETVIAFETLLCMDDEFQRQWTDFAKNYDLKFYNTSKWNTTTYDPHLFLRISETFDSLVEDISLIRDMVHNMLSTNRTSGPTLADAWNYAASAFERTDKDTTFRSLFANVDAILSGVSSSTVNVSISEVWARISNCTTITGSCRITWNDAWKYSLEAASVVLDDVAGELLTYFTEINEPDANILQLIGFTRDTGLYILYDKLPEFVGALLNSFWDYGFMVQVRRASSSQFWECEALLQALIPPVGSSITPATISKVQPFLCPSLLYWISMPRGANAFLNIIAKPQYTFYNLDVQNLTSRFESAFIKATELSSVLKNINNKNDIAKQDNTSISTLENRLKEVVDYVIDYRINETDSSYRLFNEINKKQFIAATYLTRITAMVNKLAIAIESLSPGDIKTDLSEDEVNKLKTEISIISRIFKRRPHEAIAFHFDVLTDVLSTNRDSFSLVKALEATCGDLKNNYTYKDILNESQRTKNQICGKEYKVIYAAVENVIKDDYENAQNTLLNMIHLLRDADENSTDALTFFKDRKKLVNSLRTSVRYAYDLGLPVYLKYLHSNLQSYNIVLGFLSGSDWWSELRAAYDGPRISDFFNGVEKSLDISVDVLTRLDQIQIVRLLRDIGLNDTASFCQNNVSLSDYLPDGTGTLSRLKLAACSADNQIFREIPPLLFASQGYDTELTIPMDIDYASLESAITRVESRLNDIKIGRSPPRRPAWVTDEGLARLRKAAQGLLKAEALTKGTFGLLANIVDASTLFLNSSQCGACSAATECVKQVTLQLYKRHEYRALLCRLPALTPPALHATLTADFHWDMAFTQLISSRNYTKFELNKSLNELLEQVKLYVLEEVNGSHKMADCLASDTDEPGPHAATFIKILADTLTLFRVELPYLHEVDGMTEVAFLKELHDQVAPNLDVYAPLKSFLKENIGLSKKLAQIIGDHHLIKDIESADINLRLARRSEEIKDMDKYLKLNNHIWSVECKKYNCQEIVAHIHRNINTTLVAKELPKLQTIEFWKFKFISSILYHVENVLKHIATLVRVISRLDLAGVGEGRVAATVDMVMELMAQEVLANVVSSIHGILEEAAPLLNDSSIAEDLRALTNGLLVLQEYKNYLIKEDIKVAVGSVWADGAWMERELSALGLNHTNLWAAAAPALRAATLTPAPLLSWKPGQHIADFVCNVEQLSRVLVPGELPALTRDDVLGAVADQFCGLEDKTVKEMLSVIIRGVNFTYVLDKVTTVLLTQLYLASNLSREEGEQISSSLPRMASVLPSIQAPVGETAKTLAQEPLLQSLRNFSSVGSLLESPDFMANAGKMLCGKPFTADVSRVYRSVLQNQDMADAANDRQLETLPTDFCRSVYKGITQAPGGKIVWSFVKPLLLGKVLYTPPTPLVQRIIQKANSTFAHMANLTSLVHSFSEAFSSVDQLSAHKQGVEVLKNMLSSPAFEDLKITLIGDGEVPNVNVDDMFDEIGDLQGVGSILSKASSLLRCISLDRFRVAADEDNLAHDAATLATLNEFTAGLVFLNDGSAEESITNVRYKIRMDIDNTPTTARLKNYLWIPGPEDSFLEHLRYFRGFVQLQDIVDRAIIQVAKESTGQGRYKREASDEDKWAMYTQQMPYPCYRKDFFQTSLYESQALIVAFFFSMLFSVASIVRFLVADRETGNTMLMGVMGVNVSYCTISWAIWSAIELAVTYACICAVLTVGGVLPRTSYSLLLMLLMLAELSLLSFCYMMSKLFNRASFAAVCTAIAYLITFMPIVLILSLEAVITKTAKLLICLSMSSALCSALVALGGREAVGTGAGWDALWAAPPDHLSIGDAALMMLLDAAIYLAIGWTLDRFFGLKTLQSCIVHSGTSEEKAGVSIVNVSKVYGSNKRAKMALDNVSIELHRGQITTLLGHNGAGKTTLINIITGMLKPTRGQIVMRGEGAGGSEGVAVGACPQRDVVYAQLTPREHVELYARLKAAPGHDVSDEIEEMLQVMNLAQVSEVAVSKLSGGTRRRVCVALAFVGRPNLVTLDEPTAGVDPAARRAIWSMIVKLRKDRTVLLTTHHLDEAELLSDNLVIMHKGQVHTTGSPVEIKRTLGSGYNLSVTYPSHSWSEDTEDEERTKLLLTTTRQAVPNASLTSSTELETQLLLPFYDNNGLNNDYLQLCLLLESQQEALGYSSFTLECSSLEQILSDICQQTGRYESIESSELPCKSSSSCSERTESAPLVDSCGPLKGSVRQQFCALMRARMLHYLRNRWLSFVLVGVPVLFVCAAMAFSRIRPPADNERALLLAPPLYRATDFLALPPSVLSKDVDPSFAERVLRILMRDKDARYWSEKDNPVCECGETRQICQFNNVSIPQTMVLPDVHTLNEWLIKTQQLYIEKRYGGYTSVVKHNMTTFIAWYNNKGHHALPAFVSGLNSAVLKAVTGNYEANITTYSHPLKISTEQISKDTVYQHVADAGISGLVVLAYCLVSGGAGVYLVTSRRLQLTRLTALAAAPPALTRAAALLTDITVIVINMVITAALMEAFHFPVFVDGNNLAAICLLIFLYGFACSGLMQVAERIFSDAGVASMVLFCGNAMLGLGGLTVLLILDLISQSDATDSARRVLHRIFLLAPPFALGDGLLEIAKNTIQAQVLSRFGMETYKDPLSSDLVGYHYIYLIVVGTALLFLNLALDYQCFDSLLHKLCATPMRDTYDEGELEPLEPLEVGAERRRVLQAAQAVRGGAPLRLHTIGNINAGFVGTEGEKRESISRAGSGSGPDAAWCVRLGKQYRARPRARTRPALHDLTLALPAGQCTALLGVNGAGKSTTFSLLTGQIRPTSGQIYILGKPANRRRLCQGYISYCPQTDAIDPLLTVKETLSIFCQLRGIQQRDEVIRRTIDMFELRRYTESRAGALSGGNKRKLCTAIAFMSRSPLVLLDEPTSGMDPVSRACVWRGVRAACRQRRAVLLATHRPNHARSVCARAALLHQARLHALTHAHRLASVGGGYVVECVVGAGSAKTVWHAVRGLHPPARLLLRHHRALHVLLPARYTVDGKEVTMHLSEVFKLMAQLQGACDIEDYTVNQTSLDQMFLNTDEKVSLEDDCIELEPLPPPKALRPDGDQLDSVTAL